MLSKIILLIGLVGVLNLSTAAADSAGIVEMVNGLAYGGIPYGSVTGMVAKYPGFMNRQANLLQARQLDTLKAIRPVIITSNLRAAQVVGAEQQTVQIYNLPRIVAPGAVSTISQLGF